MLSCRVKRVSTLEGTAAATAIAERIADH